jgi:hypothetical protein
LGFRGFNSTSVSVTGLPVAKKNSRPPYLKVSYVVKEEINNAAPGAPVAQKDKNNTTENSESMILDEKTLETIRSLGSGDENETLDSKCIDESKEEVCQENSSKKEHLIACISTAPSGNKMHLILLRNLRSFKIFHE